MERLGRWLVVTSVMALCWPGVAAEAQPEQPPTVSGDSAVKDEPPSSQDDPPRQAEEAEPVERKVVVGPTGIHVSLKHDPAHRGQDKDVHLTPYPFLDPIRSTLAAVILATGVGSFFFGGTLLLVDALWFLATAAETPMLAYPNSHSMPYLSMPFALLLPLMVLQGMSLVTITAGILLMGLAPVRPGRE